MKQVYLVQHGKATSEAENPARPLTDEGRSEVQQVAAIVARPNLKVSTIYHSGKLRARETAELFARALGVTSVREIEGLSPLEEPARVQALIAQADHPVMLVGHLPHLSKLVSALVGTDREVVTFQMGGVVALVQAESGWQIAWMLTPDVVKHLGLM